MAFETERMRLRIGARGAADRRAALFRERAHCAFEMVVAATTLGTILQRVADREAAALTHAERQL